MNKIREEFDKWMGESTGYDGYEKGYVYVGFEAGCRSKGKEIKKLKYNIEGYKSDISARVEIRRDLINKNKKLKTLLKTLYENKHDPDKLYIFWSKVRKALE